ncbi:MAG TPA: hypothetical protein VMV94_02825 [Phycisphaerae bacterium]|nr:hypothetical protein [Phycisphaerae bacterium]
MRKKKQARYSRLSDALIIKWAKAHYKRFGTWPTNLSGPVAGVPGMTWAIVNYALSAGSRGFRGGDSLPRFLHRRVGKPLGPGKPDLTLKQIITWANQHHSRTGRWPNVHSGPVVGGQGESWASIDQDLRVGARGLHGGTTLARLLDSVVGPSRRRKKPPLTIRQILVWADRHHKRTGEWPTYLSGRVRDARGETWAGVSAALRVGGRGLPGGDKLTGVLARYRGRPDGRTGRHRRISVPQILAWAESYRRQHGRWPSMASGPVEGLDDLTWGGIDRALRWGARGVEGGRSIAQLLQKERGSSAKSGFIKKA